MSDYFGTLYIKGLRIYNDDNDNELFNGMVDLQKEENLYFWPELMPKFLAMLTL